MENKQIKEFLADAFEVPARNVQSLQKVKIPAVIQFFKNSQENQRGQKGQNYAVIRASK